MKIVKQTTCTFDEALWLDYIENDLEPDFRNDLEAHLPTCEECRHHLASWQKVMSSLDPRKPVRLPEEAVFDRLHDQIMEQVVSLEVEQRREAKPQQWRMVVGAAAASVVLVFGTLFLSPEFKKPFMSSVKPVSIEEQYIVQSAAIDPTLVENVLLNGHQEADDLIFDAAASRLSHMTDREALNVLNDMK